MYESESLQIVLGIYLGMVAATTIYNLFLYLSLRDPPYLALVALSVLVVANDLGWILGIGLALPFAWTALVAFSFVEVFSGAEVDRARWLAGGGLLIVGLLELFELRFSLLGLSILSLSLAYGSASGLRQFKKGSLPGLYLGLGFALVLMGQLVALLVYVVPSPDDSLIWVARLLFSIAAILLAIALAERIRVLRRAQKRSSERADSAQSAALEQELQAAESARRLKTRLVAQQFSEQESRRSYCAAELHDGLGQDLLVATNALTSLQREGASHFDQPEALTAWMKRLKSVVDDVRGFSRSLHPSQLEVLGLGSALLSAAEELCRQNEGVVIEVEADSSADQMKAHAKSHVYRLAQALMQVFCESGSPYLSVELRPGDGYWHLHFFARSSPKEFSIDPAVWQEISQRVEALGGDLRREESESEGSEVHIEWSLSASVTSDPRISSLYEEGLSQGH